MTTTEESTIKCLAELTETSPRSVSVGLAEQTETSPRSVGLAEQNETLPRVGEEDDRPVKSGIREGWWWEWIDISMGGQAFCIKVSDVLYRQQSPYQDILIFKRSAYTLNRSMLWEYHRCI